MPDKTHFPHLQLLTGDELQSALNELLIDDDDGVSLVMIRNIDESHPQFGHCMIIDRDGTTNIYKPELGGTIEQAEIRECFESVTHDGYQAMTAFAQVIAETVRQLKLH